MFVRLWMTENPISIKVEQSVAEAQLCLQENSIRRLPVVDESHQLVGIVSLQDISNVLPSVVDGSSAGSQVVFAESTTVAEIMTPNPMWVELMTPLETVARRMRKHKVGGMPVLDDGTLVGIITESDIFLAFMEVLGVNEEGMRVEMIISKKSKDFYDIIGILKRYGVSIFALSIHHSYGKNQRLLTMRIMGEELDDTLKALRKSGVQINRIQEESDEA
ncbi:MAG: CBS domain-containing protein [Desulfobulbaceae bacterium]|nr:CBS domain-containing protein [Desulfobulbaceae bacterium]